VQDTLAVNTESKKVGESISLHGQKFHGDHASYPDVCSAFVPIVDSELMEIFRGYHARANGSFVIESENENFREMLYTSTLMSSLSTTTL
jgi:hypothetical protein